MRLINKWHKLDSEKKVALTVLVIVIAVFVVIVVLSIGVGWYEPILEGGDAQ